jgi:hypothetical protein
VGRNEARLGRILLLALAAAGVVALLNGSFSSAGAAVSGSTAGQTVFYANVANTVPGSTAFPNRPVVRPALILETNDGHWVIAKLRWSSWGGNTARATGISSASDCNPSCAGGKRTHDPTQLVLSNPKPMFGQTVYSCFQLTIPARPQANQHECLSRSFGKQYAYSQVAGSPVNLEQFLSPDRKIWCTFEDVPGSRHVACGTGPPAVSVPMYSAQVSSTGRVVLCHWNPGEDPRDVCIQNWNDAAPVLKAGQSDIFYIYRCNTAASSVSCVVLSGPVKGNGFRISASGATKITP